MGLEKSNMRNNLLRNVTLTAVCSRFSLLFLQFCFNILIPDHESDGFITPATNISKSNVDEVINWTLGGLLRWDAQYFIHISIYGYVYENSLAFFPGFPLCISMVATVLRKICQSYLNIVSVHLMSSTAVNVICFVCAARTLFHLTYEELRDIRLAYVSSLLFCINPASIFFVAPYSESLFCLLSFCAMRYKKLFPSSVFIAFSALTRSNGIINLGFPIYRLLENFVNYQKSLGQIVLFLYKMIFACVVSLSAFITYQMYCYQIFCTAFDFTIDENVIELAVSKSYILRGVGQSGICNSCIPYFYIQKNYWNVGFLHYFYLKQLPNFLLALPIIFSTTFYCVRYFISNCSSVYTLGLVHSKQFKMDEKMFVYVVHLSLLLIVCFFFVHIQISTRLLCSSSPAIYWFWAQDLCSGRKRKLEIKLNNWREILARSRYFFGYCISYCIVGTALFCNFYPWT